MAFLLPMPAVRAGHTALRLSDGRVLFVGGSDGHSYHGNTLDVYTPATNAWIAWALMVPRLDRPRANCSVLLEQLDVIAAGRYTARFAGSSSYDPSEARAPLLEVAGFPLP